MIEEGLTGPELSVLVVCDGDAAQPFAAAQDLKRVDDGDRGPNTGGMGAYSPVPFAGRRLVDEVMERAMRPTLARPAQAEPSTAACSMRADAHARRARRSSSTTCASGTPRRRCSCAAPAIATCAHCGESAVGELETRSRWRRRLRRGVLAAEGYRRRPSRTGDVIEGLDAAGARPRWSCSTPARAADGTSVVTSRRARRHGDGDGADGRRGAGRAHEAAAHLVAGPPLPSRHRRPSPRMIAPDRTRARDRRPCSPTRRGFAAWLEVEVLAVEAWAKLGVVPAEPTPRPSVSGRGSTSPRSTSARRSPTTTSPRSSTSCRNGRQARPGAWVHYGLTSSDVVDTAPCAQIDAGLDLILDAVAELEGAIAARAREFRDTPMVGRTHGIHAEPTTFGAKLALWALQCGATASACASAARIAVGKLSGAVGTYSNVDPFVEQYVCERLGLRPVPATQVLAA